jgi:hypothetical protein
MAYFEESHQHSEADLRAIVDAYTPPEEYLEIVVSCASLADEGKWHVGNCCEFCHGTTDFYDNRHRPEFLAPPDEMLAVRLTDGRLAELCCKAAITVKRGTPEENRPRWQQSAT